MYIDSLFFDYLEYIFDDYGFQLMKTEKKNTTQELVKSSHKTNQCIMMFKTEML